MIIFTMFSAVVIVKVADRVTIKAQVLAVRMVFLVLTSIKIIRGLMGVPFGLNFEVVLFVSLVVFFQVRKGPFIRVHGRSLKSVITLTDASDVGVVISRAY